MNPFWYESAVVYSLDVATFADSNGDGVGDFEGLVGRLDHLVGLGVNVVWLQPFYPSPYRDSGYDVADYYGVSDRYGGPGDLVEFLRAADDRGIRVVIDLVANHTSDQHPWFQDALHDPTSPYKSFYVWSDERKDMGAKPMFPGEEDDVWEFEEKVGQYYLHRFYSFEPDLDLSQPRLRAEIVKVLEFWLRLGVHGFRIDGAPYVVEKAGWDESLADGHEFVRQLRRVVDTEGRGAVLMAETDVPPEQYADFFGAGDQMHLLFNFYLNNFTFLALARERAEPLARALDALPRPPAGASYLNWLRNHDELDLERLAPDERDEVMRAFGPDDDMRIYGRGIRRRLAPMLGGHPRRLAMAHALLFALPGTPVIRYGDEIGMGEDLSLDERDAVRTPMQWSADVNAGFSRAPADRLVRPVIEEGPFGSRNGVNVLDQERDPWSLLNTVGRLVRARRQAPECAAGETEVLDTGHPAVLGLRYRGGGLETTMLVNLGAEPAEARLPHLGGLAYVADVLGDRVYDPLRGQETAVPLDGYGFRWLRGRPDDG